MPYLKLQTNTEITGIDLLRKEISGLLMEQLGKPEKFIMIVLEPDMELYFAGNDEAAAFLELKSISLPSDITTKLSEAICKLLNQRLGIPSDRIYIEFFDAPPHMFGWNSSTFER
ncbi:MAG: phenylpyruvate tautomerase MIF-related protein [Bacteroidota bacterium]